MRWRRAGSAAVQAHESASRREAGMTRLGLTGGALVTSVLLASDPVAAQSPSDADKIERLERQGTLLNKQLTALQGEIRQTKKRTEPTQPPRHPQTQQVGEQQVGEETRPAAEPKKTEPAAAGRGDFPPRPGTAPHP